MSGQPQTDKTSGTYICPWNLSDVEKLVIAACYDAILDVGSLDVVSIICGEQSTSEGWKGAGNVVVFELVHLPAGDCDTIICRRSVIARFDEFGALFGERVERMDELGRFRH